MMMIECRMRNGFAGEWIQSCRESIAQVKHPLCQVRQRIRS